MLERGARVPRIDTLIKLAAALAVPVGALLEGIEWTVPASTRPGSFPWEGRAVPAKIKDPDQALLFSSVTRCGESC